MFGLVVQGSKILDEMREKYSNVFTALKNMLYRDETLA